MKNKNSINTLITLGNAAALTAAIAKRVLGEQVASSFAGTELTDAHIHQLTQTVVQRVIAKKVGL